MTPTMPLADFIVQLALAQAHTTNVVAAYRNPAQIALWGIELYLYMAELSSESGPVAEKLRKLESLTPTLPIRKRG